MGQPIALVTGGSLRLGKAIGQYLAKNGCLVYIHYNQSQDAAVLLKEELNAKGFRAEILQADLSKEEDIVSMLAQVEERSGRLDMLVNNLFFLTIVWQTI